jgi:O-acetyl-ADP-ribose deacetylase (regulator of RNase III)
MTIEYKSGDMFDEPSEAIVNTVNCVGVMGKGVALEFKRRWPDNYRAYKRLCDAKKLSPGTMFIFQTGDLLQDNDRKFLINFPTKLHWKAKSKIEYVEHGLDDLAYQVRKLGIKSLVLPPLGCGNGGLDWNEVRPLIEDKLSSLEDVKISVFAPPSDVAYTTEQENVPSDLTVRRATMMVTLGQLEKYFGGYFTRLTAQKLVYFMQVLGCDFGLKYSRAQFGPYSERLHEIFKIMEKKRYISDYGGDEPRVTVTPSTFAASDDFLKSHEVDASHLARKLSLLVEGYESPYGMELLSSVHFLAETEGITTQPEMSEALEAWNDHKRESFPRTAVTTALDRLFEDGCLSRSA